MDNKEKTLLQKIAAIFSENEAVVDTTVADEVNTDEVKFEDAAIKLIEGTAVDSPDATYIVTVSGGLITKIEEQPSEEPKEEAPAEEPVLEQKSELKEFSSKIENYNSRIEKLESIINQLSETVKVIGNLPADEIILTKESTLNSNDEVDFNKLKKYFRSEKDFATYKSLYKK